MYRPVCFVVKASKRQAGNMILMLLMRPSSGRFIDASKVLQAGAVAAVEVSAGELDGGALGDGGDDAVGADSAGGEVHGLSDTVGADTELGAANADDGALDRARLAVGTTARGRGRSRSSRGGSRGSGRGLGDEDTTSVGGSSGLRSGGRSVSTAGRLGGVFGSGRSAELTVAGSQFVHSSAASASNVEAKRGTLTSLDRVAGVGELEILALGSGALLVGNVGDEHVGEAAEGGRDVAATTAGDGDGSAVHVHLSVADLVEPGPGEGVLASGKVFGHGNIVAVQARSVLDVLGEIARGVGRAATHDGVDDLPLAVLGRSASGDGELARTATVDGRALELDLLGLASIPGVFSLDAVVGVLAREVGPRVVQRGASGYSVRDRELKFHVCLSAGGGHGKSDCVLHHGDCGLGYSKECGAVIKF